MSSLDANGVGSVRGSNIGSSLFSSHAKVTEVDTNDHTKGNGSKAANQGSLETDNEANSKDIGTNKKHDNKGQTVLVLEDGEEFNKASEL